MNRTTCIEHAKRLALGLAALALAATPSFAQTFDLCATTGSVTMPDASVIPIWGFVQGSSCAAGGATLPGPVIPATDGATLTINLTNNLPEAISVFIPGLAKTAGDPLAPQTTADPQGRERLTSFDKTVAPGATVSYSWTASEGTYLYQSGTDVRTQVPMGLYGAVVVSGGAYPAVARDEVLVFSQIDPSLNANPGAFGGARVSNWNPQYFLINGASYPDTADIAVNLSEDVLLRFVNAGLETFVPTLGGGLYMDVVAEDGNLYPYPLTQYGIELQAGKTIDAVVNAGSAGAYALYDRALHLSNGGLFASIQAAAAVGAPIAVADSYSVAEEGTLTALAGDLSFPGVLDNDTGGAAAALLVSGPSAGTLVGGLAADGSFTYTPNANFSGSDQFSYVANDGLSGPNSNVAAVTITVTPVNDAPVAVADAYEAFAGTLLVVAMPGVLGNDLDVDGDALSVGVIGGADVGLVTMNADGSFDFDATTLTAGTVATFDYDACDPSAVCSTATVTITVVAAPNEPPVAVDDTASTPKGTPVTVDVVVNDTDADGMIVPASVFVTTGPLSQRGGAVVNNGDGTVTYTPPRPSFRGTDTFQYTVDDNDGATSNVATVRINVVR